MNSAKRSPGTGKRILRVLRLLANGTAEVQEAARKGQVILENERCVRCAVPLSMLRELEEGGLVKKTGNRLRLTATGAARLSDNRSAKRAAFADQHRETLESEIEIAGEIQTAKVNLAESPLALLARRKDRNGQRFLDEAEILAGERLRADFTRGSMSPKLGVNWQAAASASGGDRGGMAEFTAAVLAARKRVENAANAVGPELSGLLLDVCCFLKGMETVELERGWPPRTAKIVLKTALRTLARHYGYMSRVVSSRRPGNIVHWGDENYRPTLEARRQTARSP
jgi:hypothetical protein